MVTVWARAAEETIKNREEIKRSLKIFDLATAELCGGSTASQSATVASCEGRLSTLQSVTP